MLTFFILMAENEVPTDSYWKTDANLSPERSQSSPLRLDQSSIFKSFETTRQLTPSHAAKLADDLGITSQKVKNAFEAFQKNLNVKKNINCSTACRDTSSRVDTDAEGRMFRQTFGSLVFRLSFCSQKQPKHRKCLHCKRGNASF